MSRFTRYPALTLVSTAGSIVVVLLVLTFLPGGVINDTQGTARIFFNASQRFVTTPDQCVTVRWEVQGIDSVFLNGEGVVGTGEREMCGLRDAPPTLRVVFQDGSTHSYALSVGILALNLGCWLLVGLALALSAAYLVVKGWGLIGWVRQIGTTHAIKLLARGLLLAGISVVAGALVVEGGLRLYLTHFGTEQERILYLYSAEEVRASADATQNGVFIGLPYLNFGLQPGGDTNQLGYRGPEISLPKPPGVFRIVALGNSTTWGSGLEAAETYPMQLQTILREQYGYTQVEVVNAGIPGGTTWYSLVDLAFRVLEIQPNLVIVYQANLDLGAALVDPECYQGNNPHRGLSANSGIWQKRPEALSPSALYRFIAYNAGWVANPQINALPLETVIECATQRTLSDEAAIKANPPVYFERNLRSLVGVAKLHGVQIMFSSWAYSPTANSEITPGWWRTAIDAHNQVTRKVADETDNPFYDLMGHFPHEGDLWQGDGFHMSKLGAREQAELYAVFLDNQGMIPKP